MCPDLLRGRDAGPTPLVAEIVPVSVRPVRRPEPADPGRFWTGHALGGAEVFSLLTDNPPRLVALIGREDAGKTTLLVSQYLQIAQGRAPEVRFCGSRTLRGWDQLASAAWEWSGELGERIVPRTTLGSHREPGLLHYAFKRRVGGDSRAVLPRVEEILLTDFPGEWFQRWSDDASYRAELPWLSRVDVFWVVVDAPRIAGDRRAARDARYLLQRVVEEARDGRPVALVLTQTGGVEGPEEDRRGDPAAWPGRLGQELRKLMDELCRHEGPRCFLPVLAFDGRAGDRPPIGVLEPLRFALTDAPRTRAPTTSDRHHDRYFHCFREQSS